MVDPAIHNHFMPLFEDFDATLPWNRPLEAPLFAHYTSLQVLENIIRSGEVWGFSPLLMNDHSELSYGIRNGSTLVKQHEGLSKFLGEALHNDFVLAFDYMADIYVRQHMRDTYVFCMCLHEAKDTDGLLSMWRGYGENGGGAAIVFDGAKITSQPDSPLLIQEVRYGTHEERIGWLNGIVTRFTELLKTSPRVATGDAAHYLFERIKLFALFTKHYGFHEEKEWRGVYLSERDPNGLFKEMLDYRNGPRGIEPVLKFKVGHIAGLAAGASFDDLVKYILLGPTVSNDLARMSMERMLDKIGKGHLKPKVMTTTTPLRRPTT